MKSALVHQWGQMGYRGGSKGEAPNRGACKTSAGLAKGVILESLVLESFYLTAHHNERDLALGEACPWLFLDMRLSRVHTMLDCDTMRQNMLQ